MRVSSIVTVLAGTVAGLGVAVVAYQSSSALPENASGGSTSSVDAPAAEPARGKARLAPCTPPAELVGVACVTEVERTVVVYDVPLGAATQPAARPSTRAAARSDDDAGEPEDADEDAYEDAYDDAGDDEGDDDQYDDHESEDEDDEHEDHEDDGSEAPEPEDD